MTTTTIKTMSLACSGKGQYRPGQTAPLEQPHCGLRPFMQAHSYDWQPWAAVRPVQRLESLAIKRTPLGPDFSPAPPLPLPKCGHLHLDGPFWVRYLPRALFVHLPKKCSFQQSSAHGLSVLYPAGRSSTVQKQLPNFLMDPFVGPNRDAYIQVVSGNLPLLQLFSR